MEHERVLHSTVYRTLPSPPFFFFFLSVCFVGFAFLVFLFFAFSPSEAELRYLPTLSFVIYVIFRSFFLPFRAPTTSGERGARGGVPGRCEPDMESPGIVGVCG